MMKIANRIFSWGLIIVFVFGLVFVSRGNVEAVSTGIVISQVYGAGGNSGATFNKDYIELFNLGTSTINLTGLSLQYASATGNFNSAFALTGSVSPGQYYLVAMAAGTNGVDLPVTPDLTGTLYLGAAAGKVILANGTAVLSSCGATGNPCSTSLYVDLVGYGTTATVFEGSGPTPAPSTTLAVFRGSLGCTDTDNNNTDFTAAAAAPRNSGSPTHTCTGPTNPSGVGTATPSTLFAGDTTLLTVAVTPGANPTTTGHTVTCNLSDIGGSASQAFSDDGTNGDVTIGDSTFSFSTAIAGGTSAGAKSLICTIGDNESRPGSATIGLTVIVVLPIGTVNGVISDSTDAPTHNAAYNYQTVTIQGVIYELTLQAISNSTNTYKGFYIQNTAETADGDANTSDGLFVFMNQNSTFSGYTPTVGDEVVISGSISEYYNMTELTNPTLVQSVIRSDVDLDAELAPFVANPPVNLADANRYWERRQGMRGQVPANSLVLNGRNVFSPADAEIWLARADSTIALRADAYARRSFRDANPLDDNYDASNWDGNGYRILMGSLGIKGALGDAQALLVPARTFDTLTNAPVGGVNYSFSKYRIEVTTQPILSEGVDPAANNPPTEISDRSLAYSIADYNLENLYDYRDNPFSGCDFTGNSGCPKVDTPFLAAVTPPYDYVPANNAAYQARLNDIALQIINDLHNPDILMVQEVENQDICSVISGTFTCSTTDGTYADSKPDVLQELALKIASLGGSTYDAAFDPNSSDLRGIAPAFLYRTDRVELLPPAGDPILGSAPDIVYPGAGVAANADISNPKTLNAVLPVGVSACETSWVFPRAPDIGLFRIYSTSIGVGSYRDVYVINNHFKSTPDTCVAHRTEQAKYNAAIVAFLQAANPNARIVVGGDLNVYPRPDDPFAPIGQPPSSDQLGALYDPSLGLKNLWEVLLDQDPESAYSYVYLGMAQTLDQMFVSQPMLADLMQFRIAHINNDFPADYPSDVARGTSDHDPNVATFVMAYRYYFPIVFR
ncbi:MAG TPA: lamin tail domain-containing protein [Anaerolineales bacterium]